MQEKIMQILKTLPTTQLAKISCEINTWRFPEELKSINPNIYDIYSSDSVYEDLVYLHFHNNPPKNKELSDFFHDTLSPIRGVISSMIGEKEISRYWNVIHRTDSGKMDNDEFNLWWESKDDIRFDSLNLSYPKVNN